MKAPVDTTPYPQDRRSRAIDATIADGGYVFVRDITGIIPVLPDGPHMHPLVLGGAQPAIYAGDMTIRRGRVVDLTNLSGTFEFDDDAGLKEVAKTLRQCGLLVEQGAVRFFPANGSRPIILE